MCQVYEHVLVGAHVYISTVLLRDLRVLYRESRWDQRFVFVMTVQLHVVTVMEAYLGCVSCRQSFTKSLLVLLNASLPTPLLYLHLTQPPNTHICIPVIATAPPQPPLSSRSASPPPKQSPPSPVALKTWMRRVRKCGGAHWCCAGPSLAMMRDCGSCWRPLCCGDDMRVYVYVYMYICMLILYI